MLSLDFGIDAPMFRPVTDFGEKGYPTTPTRTVRVARKLNQPAKVASDAGGEAWTQTGLLYVYRGEDVLDGDKFRLPEGDFIVFGPAENDYLNPLDGNNFGVKRYNIERG